MGYGQVNVGGTKVIDDTLATMTNFTEMASYFLVGGSMLARIINKETGEANTNNGSITIQKQYFKILGDTITILKSGKYRLVKFTDGSTNITDETNTYTANQTIIRGQGLTLIYNINE